MPDAGRYSTYLDFRGALEYPPRPAAQAVRMTFRLNVMRLLAAAILSFLAPLSHGKPHGCTLDRNGNGPFTRLLNKERHHVEHGGDRKTKSMMLRSMSAKTAP